MINLNILTKQQTLVLEQLSKSNLTEKFYLSGGTAIVLFYHPYRISDDLNFFCEEEVNIQVILTEIKKLKEKMGYDSLDFETINNRNLVFLKFKENNYILKTEFTYYPFTRVENGQKFNMLNVDSITDIAVNKLFTIYTTPRYRDFTDLYTILTNNKIEFNDILKFARIKFDWEINEMKLSEQLSKVTEKKDAPQYIGDFNEFNCEKFFLDLSESLFSNKISYKGKI